MLQPHQNRVIFLDFDGVLHKPKAIAGARPPLTPSQIKAGWPEPFEHLPLLTCLPEKHLNVAVMVSSSWRLFLTDDELKELLLPIGPWFVGSVKGSSRDVPIKQWLARHPVKSYVILDDVARFFEGEWPTLILCNSALGLSDPKVRQRLQWWLDHGQLPIG